MKIAKNHVGERYGKLTVIERSSTECKSDVMWKCKCDCGNHVDVTAGNLKRTQSCGCFIIENRKHKEIIGLKKGRLTIIEEIGSFHTETGTYRMVLCRCDCGNLVTKRLTAMFYENDRSGESCGCLKGDIIRKRNEAKPDYGIRKHPIYRVWGAMRRRCYREKDGAWERYGGRGISVCDEWRYDFIPFYNWAMSNGYERGLTIDRIDNNGNYKPSNCRWTTHLIQANNTRKTTYVIWNGEKIAICLACRSLGLKPAIIRQRMTRNGYSFEEAISIPLKRAS